MSPEEGVGRGGHKLALAGPLVERYDDPVEELRQDAMAILDGPSSSACTGGAAIGHWRNAARSAPPCDQALRPASAATRSGNQTRCGRVRPAGLGVDRGR